MVFTLRTRKGNYRSISLNLFIIPVLALVTAVGVSIFAAVCQSKYQKFYEETYDAIASGRPSVTLKTSKLSKLAVTRCVWSTPELFNVSSFSYRDTGDTTVYYFERNEYNYNYEANLARYNEALDKMVAEAPSFSSKRDAVKWIHDYIIEHYDYDYSLTSSSALSMIDRGVGTCNAYTSLFSALCKRFGIEYAVKTGIDHTWNAVKIGLRWYHVDVTWDDPGAGGEPIYDYFLKTDSEIKQEVTHHGTWDDTGVSLAEFESKRNFCIMISAGAFLLLTVFSLLPLAVAYFRK